MPKGKEGQRRSRPQHEQGFDPSFRSRSPRPSRGAIRGETRPGAKGSIAEPVAPTSPTTWQLIGQLSTIGMSFVFALVIGFGGGLLARRRARHQAVALVHRVFPRAGRRRAQRLSRPEALERQRRRVTRRVDRRVNTVARVACVDRRSSPVGCGHATLAAPLGVLGGGAADRAVVLGDPGHGGRADRGCRSERRNPAGNQRRFQLVKFFTRHGMLALAAYVMMVRLHLDPVGLLAGVSSLAVAVAVEVLRDLRWRRFP